RRPAPPRPPAAPRPPLRWPPPRRSGARRRRPRPSPRRGARTPGRRSPLPGTAPASSGRYTRGRHMLARPMAVAEHTDELDGQPVFWRSAPGPDTGRAPVLYLHGVPDSSDIWVPFLERTGGIAPDLPGFGRSTKRGDFDYSIGGYDRWLERFLAHVRAQRF